MRDRVLQLLVAKRPSRAVAAKALAESSASRICRQDAACDGEGVGGTAQTCPMELAFASFLPTIVAMQSREKYNVP